MAGFHYAYSLGGGPVPKPQKCYIPDATAAFIGQPFNFTQGTGLVVLAGEDDFDDPIEFISLQDKTASDGTTEILCLAVTPDMVFKYHCNKSYTLTGGSTTTAVDSSIVPQTDDFWIGGAFKILSCAASSELNGTIHTITDSTGATGTLTTATMAAALAASDTINLCPGYMAKNHLGYDLSSDWKHPDWDADGGTVLRLVDSNPNTMDAFFRFEFASATS